MSSGVAILKTFFVTAVCGTLLLVGTARAQTKPAPADLKAIQTCLERQEQGLGRACIGVVADPCIAASSGDVGKARACATRELAVWEREMLTALKRVSAGGFKEVTEAVTQSQKSWKSSLRRLCAVFDKTDPGMLPGGAVYCRMHETAARALMLRRLGETVSEH